MTPSTSAPSPTSDLEDRLRSHYQAVASSMPDAVPEFAPRLARRRVWPAVAMGTLAVAALAVVGLVIATHDTPSTAPAAAGDEFPRLMPGWLPSGFELAGASDPGEQPQPPSRQVIYAESPGVLSGRMLLVTVTSAAIDSFAVAGEAVTIDGRVGYASPREAGAQLVVDNHGNGSVALVGRGFTGAELATIAGSLGTPSLTPGSAPVFDPAPAGLTLVSDEAGPVVIQSSELTYEAPQSDGSVHTVGVAVYTDTAHGFDAYVVMAHPGTPETLDGQRAFRSVATDGATRLAWELRPGVVVEVRIEGLSDADLTRIARGLRVVTLDDWRNSLVSKVTTAVTATTSLTAPVTAPCTRQEGTPPVTVVVPCGA